LRLHANDQCQTRLFFAYPSKRRWPASGQDAPVYYTRRPKPAIRLPAIRSSSAFLNAVERAVPAGRIIEVWGIHLTGVERRLGQWNVAMPAPTTLSLLGSFRLGSRLMQTAWTTWNGCDGLAASSARAAVVREDGGLGTAGSCVLDAVAAHQ